jgi:hypothetical protein
MRIRAVPAVVLAVIATGCGGGAADTGPAIHGPDPLAGISARLIASQALAGLEHADSVRISGTFTERPPVVFSWAQGPVHNIVSLVTGKTACTGTDTVSGLTGAEDNSASTPRQRQGSYQFIRIGNQSWVKGDSAFYTRFWFMDDGMSDTAGSKYVYLEGRDDANTGRLCDPSRWLTAGFTLPPGARPAKAGRILLSGTAALEIRVTPAEYLYVSDTRTPRLLRATVPGTEDATFTGYGAPVQAIKPAASDTITETAVIAANR